MKKLITTEGYYISADRSIVSKIIFLPDSKDETSYQHISEEEGETIIAQHEEQIRQAYEAELARRQAELEALQSFTNEHLHPLTDQLQTSEESV